MVSLWAGYILYFDDQPAKKASTMEAAPGYEQIAAEMRKQLEAKVLSRPTCIRCSLRFSLWSPRHSTLRQSLFISGAGQRRGRAGLQRISADGNKAYAIINGIEYAVGDDLAEGGYRLTAITKGYVVLERRDEATGRVFRRQLPMTESMVEDITLRRFINMSPKAPRFSAPGLLGHVVVRLCQQGPVA